MADQSMHAYRAMYRKFRPTRFEDVLGQEHITTTLKNQVECGRVSHAYVFSGSRGTGKTTTAQILARAVNCLSPNGGEPCGECANCLAATESADIVELDAASNNGVDDVRAIIDKARFTPMQLKRKVYIIDEAHMLTRPAFNALLKTLEEPPAHILFVLATTEPQSLPATILSRCQRFDFHRIGIADIVSCVRSAAQKSGAEIDEEGLLAIARAAEGGMRDALSIADQCIAFCGSNVSAADIYGVLGGMDSSFIFKTADALIGCDGANALRCLDEVIENGRDISVFAADITKHFRALLIAKLCGRCEDILNCTGDAMKRYIEQAQRCGETRLRTALDVLMEAMGGMRYLALPRIRLESAFIRIALPEKAASEDIHGMIERMEALEDKLKNHAFTPKEEAKSEAAIEKSTTPHNAPRANGTISVANNTAPLEGDKAEINDKKTGNKAESAKGVWNKIRNAIQQKNQSMAVLCLKAQVSLKDGVFDVCMPNSSLAAALSKDDIRKVMEDTLENTLPGTTLRIGLAQTKTDDMAEKALLAFGTKLEIVD